MILDEIMIKDNKRIERLKETELQKETESEKNTEQNIKINTETADNEEHRLLSGILRLRLLFLFW